MDYASLDSKRALLEESIDSGEFFLSQLRQRLQVLQSKHSGVTASLSTVQSEEKALRIQLNKLQGLMISQYVISAFKEHFFSDQRSRQDVENLRNGFRSTEEHLWASRLDKEAKCKRLEGEIEALKRKPGWRLNQV